MSARYLERIQRRVETYDSNDDSEKSSESDVSEVMSTQKPEKKRKSKNAPTEISSKKRQIISNKAVIKRESRDPRFEPLCGRLDNDSFRNNYSFLEDMESNELAKAKTKKKKKSEDDDPELIAMRRRRTERQRADREKAVIAAIKKEERAKVKSGKKPFYLKRAAIKQKILDDRFNQLRSEGKLNKFLKRKRRRARVDGAAPGTSASAGSTGLAQRVLYSDPFHSQEH